MADERCPVCHKPKCTPGGGYEDMFDGQHCIYTEEGCRKNHDAAVLAAALKCIESADRMRANLNLGALSHGLAYDADHRALRELMK